ncbi:heavy metal sensor histidine kinase [Methylophaga sp.]|uniref:heavy metal sensor histidine kinase n=1 Tax=Methylophaga sp. TaxID=2024840 RepID=UPI0025ECE979|nr:heavy metal sensor histidine kinase [Methylophaga sp.]
MTRFNLGQLSLTLRLMMFVGTAIALSLIVSGFLVLKSVKNHFAEQDYEELVVVLESIKHQLNSIDADTAKVQQALSKAVSGHHGIFFRVDTVNGKQLFLSKGAEFLERLEYEQKLESASREQLKKWQIGNGLYRGLIAELSVNGQTYNVITAMDMAFHKQFLDKFTIKMWLMMLAIGIVTMSATWFGIYQGHRPLKSLSTKIRNIQTNQLDERLNPDDLPIELRDLALSFNEMLQHVEEGFERLSNFSADIAHELRTPLTNIITQNQVMVVQHRSSDEYRELLYSNLEELERLAKMVSQMLWLAQSDNKLIKPAAKFINLNQEVKELLEFFEALASEKNIKLIQEGELPRIYADRDLLRRAISNLISNAIRHTPSGKAIRVVASANQQDKIQLDFINPGKPIPGQHLTKVFDRFYRVDPSRSEHPDGTGLGLAITKSIIEAHGGNISVDSNLQQTVFTIWLPINESDKTTIELA